MSLLHKFDTSFFCDFDPDSYPIFFQHFDQKTEQIFGLAIGEQSYWDTLAELPDEGLLLASMVKGKLWKLRLSQFRPNLDTSKLLTVPDLHGNILPASIGGLVLPGRLWQSVGKNYTLDWVAELMGLQVTYYDPPQTTLWDYSRPIGRTYCHLEGSPDLVTWVQHWIEPNARPIGNPSLDRGYALGSLFRPIVGANLVSIRYRGGGGDVTLPEGSINKASFDKKSLPLVEPELSQDVGFNVQNSETRKPPVAKIELLPRQQLSAEGNINAVGFTADKLKIEEPILVPNMIGFSERYLILYNEYQ